MPNVALTERFDFSASHRLYNPAWDTDHNKLVFGLCAGQHVHGHNFSLWVSVKAPLKAEGVVCMRGSFRQIVEQNAITQLDKQELNQVSLLAGANPTVRPYLSV